MHFVCWPSPKTFFKDANVFYLLLHSEWSKLWEFLSEVRLINAFCMLASPKTFFKMQMNFIYYCTQNGQSFGYF